jgi:anti-sigma B factor antagonist
MTAAAAVHIEARGELDLATVPALLERIAPHRRAGNRVVVDLRSLTFMDSSGLRMLLQLYQASAGEGWELVVVPGPPGVQRMFELTGMEQLLPFVDDTLAQ